eukprot:TRINITY_DN5319_c3_g1_i1.p1 TRINITY_DN5319_c3_g1~~TRINITY_DN5319_c3_g1_i1.p1  ORF type:complete len:371 (+),score=99.72 TRINITY_DN5319_c3_g1_i1:178-1290(+)
MTTCLRASSAEEAVQALQNLLAERSDGQNSEITSIVFKEARLGDDGAVQLAEALKSVDPAEFASLRTVDLSHNSMGAVGLQHILEALSALQCPKLVELELSFNSLADSGCEIISSCIGPGGCLSQLEILGLAFNLITETGVCHLTSALARLESPSLQELGLEDNNIGLEGAQHLSSLLKQQHLKFLKQEADGVEVAARLTPLTRLCLANASLGVEGSVLIAEALQEGARVEELNLQDNGLGQDGAKSIADAIGTEGSFLRSLNLWHNAMEDAGILLIAESLQKNGKLEVLNLGFNSFTDEAADALADALEKRGQRLRELNVEFNEIGERAAARLAQALDQSLANIGEPGGVPLVNAPAEPTAEASTTEEN